MRRNTMPTRDYHSYLIKRLGDPEYTVMYLKAALAETLADGDWSSFLQALKNVVEAKSSELS
ncbi:hypothetical protein I4641_13820 [Waterburya agarophytonicola K14]|uniref:Uncharacterized protein n=1 Tax=Waterburya agarophytonicola KI4 TaxID=2874699 RepID=A0A964BT53_9CYAN|nr:hypothetical protein [Waterburya agarophytonicola]MCC0178058.1 hypothetical protein [Waterburya agarophytonicola KI4]